MDYRVPLVKEKALGRWKIQLQSQKGKAMARMQSFTYSLRKYAKIKKRRIEKLIKGEDFFSLQSLTGVMSDSRQTVPESLVNRAKYLGDMKS